MMSLDKNVRTFTITFLLLLLMVLFSFCNLEPPSKLSEQDYYILDESLNSTEGNTVEMQTFAGGEQALLSFISPDCEHCHYQTKALLTDHDDKPTNLRLAFLSDVHQDSLKAFANQFEY